MRRLHVGLDLDGVCHDFDGQARRVLREVFGEDPGPGPSHKWDALKHQVSCDAWDWLWTEGVTQGLYAGPPTAGTEDALKRLNGFCDITVITSRPLVAADTTHDFCERLGICSDVRFVDSLADKAQHDFDVWIEDAPDAIEALIKAEKRVIVFDQPWNRDGYWEAFSLVTRARTWSEVVNDCEMLHGTMNGAPEQTGRSGAVMEGLQEPNRSIEVGARLAGDPRFHAHLACLADLHNRKAADYGKDEDPLANVRASEEWGIPPWVGAMARLTDKVRRLQTFARKGQLQNESALDSFDDIAVYAIIAKTLYLEQSEEPHP